MLLIQSLSCCRCCVFFVFFFKQKTAYEMRISDWSSDVCSSDLRVIGEQPGIFGEDRGGFGVFDMRLERDRPFHPQHLHQLRDEEDREIGRASCRERVCQYV